jgi:hypothetical protein
LSFYLGRLYIYSKNSKQFTIYINILKKLSSKLEINDQAFIVNSSETFVDARALIQPKSLFRAGEVNHPLYTSTYLNLLSIAYGGYCSSGQPKLSKEFGNGLVWT